LIAGFHLFLKSVTSPATPGDEFMLHTAPLHHGSLRRRAAYRPASSWKPLVTRALACGSPFSARRFASARHVSMLRGRVLSIDIHHVIGSV